MNYHDVLEYVRGVTPETDVNELLDFSARVITTDPLLATLPILFYSYRNGDVGKLVKVAHLRKKNAGVEELIMTFRSCLFCESQHEFRAAFYELSLQVAKELDDEQSVRFIESTLRCSQGLPSFDEEGR